MVVVRVDKTILPLVATALLALGCRTVHVRTPEFHQVSHALSQAYLDPDPIQAAIDPVVAELAGPHPVEDYIRFALTQNPGIQAARSRVDAAANRVPQAASLKDPTLDVMGWPFPLYAQQVAGGRMTVDTSVSQEVPWFGKLRTRAAAAEEEVNAARAQLAAKELEVIEQVTRAYYQLNYLEQAIRITQESRQLLTRVLEIADAKYKTGDTSQQDVLRLQAQLFTVDSDLVRLQQELESSRADLTQLLHVSPETAVQTIPQTSVEDIPRDLNSLYQQAIAARPELHAVLSEVQRNRENVELAHLEYRPDVTLSVGWAEMTTNRALAPTADGMDNVTAGVMVNLPVYRKRLDAGVREAEAQVVASAREYDQLRDQTMRDVKSLFTQVTSQQELLGLLRNSIIPKTQQALDLSISEYPVGKTQFVQMLDNWRELLRLQIMQQQLEAQLRQSLASLARMLGTYEFRAATSSELPPPTAPLPPPEN